MELSENKWKILAITVGVILILSLVIFASKALFSNKLNEGIIVDDPVKGNETASVTIIEFSDFECPFCGRHFAHTYPQIIESYVDTGKVKYVFKNFPLSFHKKAQKAAEAAECAFDQGKFWEYHDTLFENQEELAISNLRFYAANLGLNTSEFDECLDSNKYKAEVKKDFEEGLELGVKGTPTFFINGKKLVGALPFYEFENAIEAAL